VSRGRHLYLFSALSEATKAALGSTQPPAAPDSAARQAAIAKAKSLDQTAINLDLGANGELPSPPSSVFILGAWIGGAGKEVNLY
jgi:hypothetical protein